MDEELGADEYRDGGGPQLRGRRPRSATQTLQAHPDLAGLVKLSPHPASEQSGAGLDHCSAKELAAVRGFDRGQLLAEFRRRVENDRETEFLMALGEIHKIARLRLSDLAET